MKILSFFIVILIFLSNSAFARNCVVFSLGGYADKPYEEPDESRHITRMNFIAEEAKYNGCKVYKAHNKSLAKLTKEMKEFIKKNNIDASYKFHFSFSDHGSSYKGIPLQKDHYVTAKQFFRKVSKALPKNSHVTYASHICYGGNLLDAAVAAEKYNINLCGSASVDKTKLSRAIDNPYPRSSESKEDYRKRKFITRGKEYLGAGWSVVREKNMNYINGVDGKIATSEHVPEKPVTMFDYHYSAIGIDFYNATKGAALSSTLFARLKLKDISVDPYVDLELAIKSSPDFYDENEYSTATLMSLFDVHNDRPISCKQDSVPETIGSAFNQIAYSTIEVIDENLNWLNANLEAYPFLQKYKDLLILERSSTANIDILNSLSDANVTYKRRKEELMERFLKSKDDDYLSELAVEVNKDKEELSESEFDKKYIKLFGEMLDKVKKFKPGGFYSFNSTLSLALKEKINSDFATVERRGMGAIRPIVKRVRLENDITMMRKFLQNEKISKIDKDHFLRMAECEVKSFI